MSDFDNPEIKISDYSAISYLQISFMIYFDEILGWDVIVYRGPIIYYILHVLTSCIRECLFHYRNHERVFVIDIRHVANPPFSLKFDKRRILPLV